MRCPHCNQEHPDTATFCPTTGQKIVAIRLCVNCGTELLESWKACPKCGTRINESEKNKSGKSRQVVRSKQSKKLARFWTPALFSVLILALIAYLVLPRFGISLGRTRSENSRVISSSEGGELALSDATIIRIPSGSLPKDTQVSIKKATEENSPMLPPELVGVGSAYQIDLGVDQLKEPVILEIPFDPALLPGDVEPNQAFLSYYDEEKNEWVFAGGEVDTSRNVIILEANHASWWQPTTWNWEAWIAILNKGLEFSIVGFIDAVSLLVDDCPQSGNYVQVDSSQAKNIIQGCIEKDEAEQLELRIVNPKSFYFEVKPISGGNGDLRREILSPGEDINITVSPLDPSPLLVEANMTQKAGWYLVIHTILNMLPGANQFGIQPHHIACITERLDDFSSIAKVADALIFDQNGVAAAESLTEFMIDEGAMLRFFKAADDCNFGPAPSWSIEGVKQIGAATSTILSFTDYAANYFASNTPARVSFIWASPISNTEMWIAFLDQNNLWLIHPDGSGLTKITTNGKESPRVNQFKWSPDGKTLAFSLSTPSGGALLLYDIQTSATRLLSDDDIGGSFDWSLTSKQLMFSTPPKPSDLWGDKGLWVINLENGKTRRVVPPSSDHPGYWNPQWSSEGSHVIYTIPAFEPAGYGVADYNSGNSIRLPLNVHGGMGMGNCEWAPSELIIACTTVTDDSPYKPELRLFDVSGTITRKILLPEKMQSPIVKWSPDGKMLAVGYYNEGKAWTDLFGLNSGDFTPLGSGLPSDWSPDGQWILTWQSGINITSTISMVNVNSRQSIPISEGILPVWQP